MRDIAPRATIRPPRLSLLSAAGAATDVPRWELGIEFPPSTCGALRLLDPCGTSYITLLDNQSDAQAYDPVALESWFECSTGTSAAALDEVDAQALATLEAMTAYGVEREFWTGDLAVQAGFPNRALVPNTAAGQNPATDLTPTAQAGTGVSPVAAVGLLEEALGTVPGQGFIHANLRGAAFLASQAVVEGNTVLTKLGSKIVAGSGYPGTGPDGATAPEGTTWVYGTGPVSVRLSPSELALSARQGLDRATNTTRATAQRLMAATWDGCGLFAVLMTLKSD
jgi:hypothetical protein